MSEIRLPVRPLVVGTLCEVSGLDRVFARVPLAVGVFKAQLEQVLVRDDNQQCVFASPNDLSASVIRLWCGTVSHGP